MQKKYVFVYEKISRNKVIFGSSQYSKQKNICFDCEIAGLLEIPIISALKSRMEKNIDVTWYLSFTYIWVNHIFMVDLHCNTMPVK